MTRFLNDFIINRKAKIKECSHIGEALPLAARVPQGSALTPTLHTIHTADLLPPGTGCTNIQYEDDITQIITYSGKSRQFIASRTINETVKINNNEKTWKIKANKNKFKIIPIAEKKKKIT